MARLHLRGLPSPLSPRAGSHLLEMYYSCLEPANGGVAFVVREGGQVTGFVAGIWNRRKVLVASLLRYPLRFPFWMIIEFGFCRGRGLFRRDGSRGDEGARGEEGEPVSGYELRPLVVDETQRGRGIGPALSRRLLDDARERGFHAVHLRVDKDNAAAIRCYEKLGFRTVGAAGRWRSMSVALDRPSSMPK